MKVHIVTALAALLLVHLFVLGPNADCAKAVLRKVECNFVTVPRKALTIVLVIATGATTMASIVAARRTLWKGDEQLTAAAIALGVILGFITDVSGQES